MRRSLLSSIKDILADFPEICFAEKCCMVFWPILSLAFTAFVFSVGFLLESRKLFFLDRLSRRAGQDGGTRRYPHFIYDMCRGFKGERVG